MAYIDVDEMVIRYGEAEIRHLTDRDNVGVIDDDIVEAAIDAAQQVIDSYIAQRYQTPVEQDYLPATPIPFYTAEIARYYLYDDDASSEVRRRYEDAIRWLEAVRDGALFLPIPMNKESVRFSMKTRKEVFSDELMETML